MLRSFVRVATAGVARATAPARVLTRSRLLYPQTMASQRFMSTKKSAIVTPKGHPEDDDKDLEDEEDNDDDEDWDDSEDWDDEDWEGNDREFRNDQGVTIGDTVPNFTAEQVHSSGSTSHYRSIHDMENRYTIMLFYPADFTFVCPTELTAFSDSIESFRELECDVIGISTDQKHSHIAWMKLPRSQGGIEGVQIPLLADPTREVTKSFGLYDAEAGQARRGTVIVDRACRVVHTSVNHAPVGRSVEEALRLVQAFQFVDEHGDQVCPANWKKGKKTMVPDHDAKVKYFEAVDNKKK